MNQITSLYNNPIKLYMHHIDENTIDVVVIQETYRDHILVRLCSLLLSYMSSEKIKLRNIYVFKNIETAMHAPDYMHGNANALFNLLNHSDVSNDINKLIDSAETIEVFIVSSGVTLGGDLITRKAHKVWVPHNVRFGKSLVALNLKKRMKDNFSEYGCLGIEDYLNDQNHNYGVDDLLPEHQKRFAKYKNIGELLANHPLGEILGSKDWLVGLERKAVINKSSKSENKFDRRKMLQGDDRLFKAVLGGSIHSNVHQDRNTGDISFYSCFDTRSVLELISSFDFQKRNLINLDIESPGGEPVIFKTMRDLLMSYSKVNVRVENNAASLGSLAMVSFDSCEVNANARIMIHCGWMGESNRRSTILDARAKEYYVKLVERINAIFEDFFLDPNQQEEYDGQNDVMLSGLLFVAHFKDTCPITAKGVGGTKLKPSDCRKMLRLDIPEENLKEFAVYRERISKALELSHKDFDLK